MLTLSGSAFNALCGDEINVRAILEDDVISALEYDHRACSVTTASARLVAKLVPGGSPAAAHRFADALSDALDDPRKPLPAGCEMIAEARLMPSRRRCARLPLDALRRALDSH